MDSTTFFRMTSIAYTGKVIWAKHSLMRWDSSRLSRIRLRLTAKRELRICKLWLKGNIEKNYRIVLWKISKNKLLIGNLWIHGSVRCWFKKHVQTLKLRWIKKLKRLDSLHRSSGLLWKWKFDLALSWDVTVQLLKNASDDRFVALWCLLEVQFI